MKFICKRCSDLKLVFTASFYSASATLWVDWYYIRNIRNPLILSYLLLVARSRRTVWLVTSNELPFFSSHELSLVLLLTFVILLACSTKIMFVLVIVLLFFLANNSASNFINMNTGLAADLSLKAWANLGPGTRNFLEEGCYYTFKIHEVISTKEHDFFK